MEQLSLRSNSVQIPLRDLPAGLSHIPRPPPFLWGLGALPTDGTRYLLVVGSRALSAYGRTATNTLLAGLAGYPISIISGLALGTDGCAHEAALAAGLHTIAVPGSGLGADVIYPRAHYHLAERIVQAGGMLLSEHPANYTARPEDFPKRNRIMVGMADAVLMIEAAADSGTLITAKLAGEYNRELLCVPHRIGDTHGYGASRFMRIGATLVTEPSHILEALHIDERDATHPQLFDSLSTDEQHLLSTLATPQSTDALISSTGMPSHKLIALLQALELRGYIRNDHQMWYASTPIAPATPHPNP